MGAQVMNVKQSQDGSYYITRDVLAVPVGLTGVYDSKELAELAIAWYYAQGQIA